MGRLSRRAFALAALATLATAPDASAVPGRRRAITGMRGVWLATVANRDWPSRPGMTAAEQRRNSSATSMWPSATASTP